MSPQKSRRAPAVLALCFATALACSGGLLLDAGNAYPCDFSLGEPARDSACPTGFICGVTNLCQQGADEGVVEGTNPPTLSQGELVAPTVLDAGVRSVGRDSKSGRVVAALVDGRVANVFAGVASEIPSPGVFRDAVLGPTWRAYLLDGGTVRLEEGTVTPTVTTLALGVGAVAQALRAHPGPPDPPLGILLTRPAPTGLQYTHYGVGPDSFRDMPVTAPLQLFDARPIPNAALGVSASESYTAVGLMVTSADTDRRPRLYYRSQEPGSWVLMEDAAAPGITLPITGAGRLRHSPNGELWAAALSDDAYPFDVLAVWQLSFLGGGPRVSRVWNDCVPCAGRVRAFQPVVQGGLAVEVLCEAADGFSRSVVRVEGSSALQPGGACDVAPLEPPVNLFELVSGDATSSTQVVLGGASGQLWVGDRLSTVAPLFLDRVPDAIGSVRLNVPDGGSAGFNLPFAPSFFSVGGRGGDFPAFPATRDAVPQAPIGGTDNWVVMAGARIAKLQAAASGNAVPYDLRFGPRLLDALGEASTGPYHGAAVGDAGLFVVSGSDSLYLYPVAALRNLPFSNPLDDLSPQLTPQAGAPIRSLAVQPSETPSDADAGITGYVISGSELYRFSRDGTPQRWDAERIALSASEPVEVWAADDGRKLGRVGFRDGSVFTLPGGLPFVEALPTDAQGRANRVFDFEQVDGYPVCYAERGLYVAKPVEGRRALAWEAVTLDSTLAAVLARPTAGRLARAPDGALLLFLDRGRVWRFTR